MHDSPQLYNILNLNVQGFCPGGETQEAEIFTFSKTPPNSELPQGWLEAHKEEFLELTLEKILRSDQQNRDCGLIEGAREYFKKHVGQLLEYTQRYKLSLPELSLVIHQGTEKRIFIPNFSVKEALKGRYVPHETIDTFFNSRSFYLINMISQLAAYNGNTFHKTLVEWTVEHGKKAHRLLEDSLEFHPDLLFVEGQSPDITLAPLGHPPYKEIAEEIVFSR